MKQTLNKEEMIKKKFKTKTSPHLTKRYRKNFSLISERASCGNRYSFSKATQSLYCEFYVMRSPVKKNTHTLKKSV